MQRNWKIKTENQAISDELSKRYQPLVLRLLFDRGIKEENEIENFFNLDYTRDVSDPFLFADMAKAVERIISAKENQEKVAIFGDYDADGVTATAVVFETLSRLGFLDVITYIPDRQTEGYGMNMEAIEYLHKSGVKLIITVDCGITNIEEVQSANRLGLDVIITDHHHVPAILPEALAVINPHIKDCGYPFENLAGVGVAFKLAQALYQKMDPKNSEQTKWLLDLVSIGTIADCVPLLGENRTLTRFGLVVLSKTKRQGLLEMFKVGRIVIDENNLPDTQKVAFQISPRINAAGRMDHANASYNLLVEKNPVLAREMALEIESKNQERQKVTGEIVREIRALAENSFKDRKLIFASNEHWPVGILGLVAGKIADEFNKPTVVLQKQSDFYVGSLRSIPRINIIEQLEKCADVLIRFGGHAQAAGVRVDNSNIENFYQRLSDLVEKELEDEDIKPDIEIDMKIDSEQISWDLVSEIKRMEPFGEGNEEPFFLIEDMVVEDLRIVGNGSKHLKLSLRPKSESPKIFDAIAFRQGNNFSDLKSGDSIDIVCSLQEDEWNGNKKIQLRLVDLRKK